MKNVGAQGFVYSRFFSRYKKIPVHINTPVYTFYSAIVQERSNSTQILFFKYKCQFVSNDVARSYHFGKTRALLLAMSLQITCNELCRHV